MFVMLTAALPVFLTVTDIGEDVTFIAVDGNVRLVGEKVSVALEEVVGHALTRLVTLMEPSPVA